LPVPSEQEAALKLGTVVTLEGEGTVQHATLSVSTYIETDESGTTWIAGANTRVIEVVLDKLAYDYSRRRLRGLKVL
jgi:hypothetical protein